MSSQASSKVKKWLTFAVRWGIAVFGIVWVVSQITWHDRLTVLGANDIPVPAKLSEASATENQSSFEVGGQAVPRERTVNRPDRKTVMVRSASGQPIQAKLLGYDLVGDLNNAPEARRILVQLPGRDAGEWRPPTDLVEPLEKGPKPYAPRVPYPRVEVGLGRLSRQASANNLGLLLLAIAIFPVTFAITSYRWHELLKPLEIRMRLRTAFELTMVGAFYNSFMPGSTGGDVLKALYASRLTTHRTRAVMSVLVDRVLGLLALIILGGAMAAGQWQTPMCRHIAIVCGLLVASVVLGLTVFYQPTLHRLFGLDWILRHMPMQKQVHNAVQTMELYRRRPMLVVWATLITLPVHATVILSATCAGKAFGLPLEAWYYWAIVPVIVLVGSLPISPQGAGVMEWAAIMLTKPKGVTVSQAFALTMSIRLVQILWNLTGGIFVLRGGYHKPTDAEQDDMRDAREEDDDATPGAPRAAGATAVPGVP